MGPDGYPSFLLCPSLFLLPNLFYLLHRNSSGLSPALQSSVTVLCLLADRVHPFLQKSKAPLNLVGASLTQPLPGVSITRLHPFVTSSFSEHLFANVCEVLTIYGSTSFLPHTFFKHTHMHTIILKSSIYWTNEFSRKLYHQVWHLLVGGFRYPASLGSN